MSSSLKHKSINSMGWSLVDNVVGTGTSFLVGLVLARLLSPGEFGIIGIIMVFLSIALIFIDSGFSQALIRKKEASPKDYNTLFWFNLMVAIVCYATIFAISGFIADFFEQPLLDPVLKVTALMLIFNALSIVQRVIFIRLLDFRTQASTTIVSSVLSGVVGIVMAFMGYGVWSLVGQILTRYLVQTIMFWVRCSWRPQMRVYGDSFREMFHFGHKLLLSGLLDTLYRNLSYIVIGKFYSTQALGQYTRAGQFANIFSANLLSVVQKVSYPVLSSIQDEPERLKAGYQKMIKTSMLLTFALILGMVAVAKPMILILIGEKWLPAVYYLQIICLAEMLYPLHAINLNILNVKGRSDLFLRLEVIKKTLAIPMILAGIYYSIEAMLWCGVLFSFVAYFLNAYYSAKLIDYPISQQVKDILPTFVVSVGVAVVMWGVNFLNLNLYVTFFLQITVGISLAIVIYNKLKLEEYLEVRSIVKSFLKRIFNRDNKEEYGT